jgi:purine nucleosidase
VLEHRGKRAGYARYALALADRTDVPVAAGADVRDGSFLLEAGLPPEERYWPEAVPAAPGPIDAALDLLERSIDQGATIVGIGPFTNLSLLERRRPGTLGRAALVLMGGHVRPAPPGFPAWDYAMDYNVQADGRAAGHVLESGEPTLVPIEVTVQTALRRSQLPALAASDPLGRLIARQAEAFAHEWRNDERFGRTCAGLPRDLVNFQHDPLACAVAIGWGGVTIERLPLALEAEGDWLRLRVDPAGGRRLPVVTAVERERFEPFWLETVAG